MGRGLAVTTAQLWALVAVFAVTGVEGMFNACLGVEVSHLPAITNCSDLYDACEAGVGKLNLQLKVPMNKLFHPVSVISATESTAKGSNATRVAMLVQLAPIDKCTTATIAPNEPLSERCTFDVTKLEVYSLLTTRVAPTLWNLDGFKHHALSVDERNQIVKQYRSGNFYGTNLAVGIFDTPPLPAEAANDAGDRTLARSPVGIFVVIASATIAIGLLFHQRRRLHNGYAPITIMKRGQLQKRGYTSTPHSDSRRVATPSSSMTEEASLKSETANERFAV